jgi:hypothetical protein
MLNLKGTTVCETCVCESLQKEKLMQVWWMISLRWSLQVCDELPF